MRWFRTALRLLPSFVVRSAPRAGVLQTKDCFPAIAQNTELSIRTTSRAERTPPGFNPIGTTTRSQVVVVSPNGKAQEAWLTLQISQSTLPTTYLHPFRPMRCSHQIR
jgi:hypothetical protein